MEAHILVCFLAHVLWKTMAQTCRAAGLGDEPRKVFEELSKVALVEVVLPTRAGVTISQAVCQPAYRALADPVAATRTAVARRARICAV